MHDHGSDDERNDDVAPLTLEIPAATPAAQPTSAARSGSTLTPPSSLIIPSPTDNRQRRRSDAAAQRRRSSSQFGVALSSSSSSSSSGSSSGSFPTPFKCCGDFCDVVVNQFGGNMSASGGAPTSPKKPLLARFDSGNGIGTSTALQLLFSDDERQLVGDQSLLRLLDSTQVARFDDPHHKALSKAHNADTTGTYTAPDDHDLRVITYKSIALAKPNKQHLARALAAKRADAATSGGPTDMLPSPDAKAKADNGRRRSSLMDPTLAHSIREGYRARVYGEMEGVANLYRQVRVCRNCYAIYTLLDRARELAVAQPGFQGASERQAAAKRGSVKATWDGMVDDEVARKEKLFLRKASGGGNSTLTGAASAPLLPLPVPTGTVLPVILSPKSSDKPAGQVVPKSLGSSTSLSTLPAVQLAHLTVTHHKELVEAAPIKPKDSIVSMDKYLRGESKQIEERELHADRLFHDPRATTRTPWSRRGRAAATNKPVASVLLLDADLQFAQSIHDMLTEAAATLPFALDIESLTDATEALRAVKETGYDLILVERELPQGLGGIEFTKLVRQHEVQRSLAPTSTKPSLLAPRTPIVCLSTKTTAADLQLYKEAGMDGCVGKPVHCDALVQTVQAALAKVMRATTPPTTSSNTVVAAATDALARAKLEQTERRRRRRRKLEAATTLPFPALLETDTRDYAHGTFQMDSETAFPFCVLGDATWADGRGAAPNTFFNLVVIHDLFDTWERLQILLNPIVSRYRGAVQILVWNYPGQAYTTWRAGTLLNNAYHCECFRALLRHVGPQGRGLLRDAPYYLVGFGNGGNIATRFCSLSPPPDPNVRALVLINAFTHVDAALAQFLHDCLKVFACTPESRPDLPVYFHSRFLFSPAYVARVTAPLALNLYTAVMNPITLSGRKALCHGTLAHADLRGAGGGGHGLRLSVPFVSVCAAQNALVNVSAQTQALVDATRVELVDSIGKVFRSAATRNNGGRKLSSVVWLASGHEVLQECKSEMLLLLEQLATGFHEHHDAPHQSAVAASAALAPGSSPPRKPLPSKADHASTATKPTREEDDVESRRTRPQQGATTKSYEDTFLDRVLTTVNQVVPSPASHSPGQGAFAPTGNQLTSPDKAKWLAFQTQTTTTANTLHSQQLHLAPTATTAAQKKALKSTKAKGAGHMSSWDPTTPAFERLSSNLIYKIGDGSKIYPDNRDMPEVKEYMAWRVQRNQKRLARMEHHVRVIQRAFRAFFARTLAWRMQRTRCAVLLQRLWRAKLARKKYHGMKREDWAVRLVQRQWRGKMGRTTFKKRMQQYLAATEIQRVVRGGLARRFVERVRARMKRSATFIQRLVRQYLSRRRMLRLRRRRAAATTIQRVFRGHVGRRRFQQEKDKFLFSKTQTQGITFGKQMLLEYKLFGTKLQSEVALLTSTKTQVEKDAEAVVAEICEFEEGIRVLEAEMHALAQLETEGLSKQMDEQAKWQLREQKMRLDREFTQMLSQIASRKEKLNVLEEKLQVLDKERLAKEEELKGLERKLVILLEEQQRELDKIKAKQSTRSQLLLDILPPHAATPGSASSPAVASPWTGSVLAPSDTKSAIQAAAVNSTSAFSTQQREEANSLMESTETMMKFGFMSMSMTYFSSMNMVRAMRKIGAHHMTLDSAAAVSNKKWPEYTTTAGPGTPGFAVNGAQSPMGFTPAAPPGSFPGQQPLQLAGWSVADVGRWLDTLALGQYKRAFQDAAVDGALLLHLNDEDLKNTLGMEHRLHRKKVLTSVEQLRESERIKMKRLYGAHNPDEMPSVVSMVGSPVSPARTLGGGSSASSSPARAFPSSSSSSSVAAPSPGGTESSGSTTAAAAAAASSKMLDSFPDFCTLVRHGKLKQIKEALAHLPERKFDPLSVAKPFAPGLGTIYDDVLEKSVFHINKGDENGNSPLLLAAQNNNLKVAQYLISKGANPNHQNKNGQTAGHYAMAYSFFDLGAWLLDPEKGGGRDDVLNENGLTAYDGL